MSAVELQAAGPVGGPARRRAVFVGLLAATTLVVGTDGVLSVTLVPYAAMLVFPAAAIGLLATTHRLVRLPLAPWVGLQADRRGRRPLLLAGVLGAAVSLLVLGAAEGFAPLLAARVL